MNKKPLISILTTSWNREKYLRKLAQSLKTQKFKNFEWIVSNDGSNDKTDEFIKRFSKKVNFRIVYIRSSLRIGKAKLTNLMMKKITGKYTIECDSDDYFYPYSLDYFIKTISDRNIKKIKNFGGIIAQNISTEGVSQTFKNLVPKKINYLKWENLYKLIHGDGTIITHSKNYKNKKYLEVDFLINESSLTNKIFKNKLFLVSPKIVKVMNRSAKNSVSFGDKLQYTRGTTYCIATNENKNNFIKKKFIEKIKTVIFYWRFSLHGDVSFKKTLNMFYSIKKNYFYILLYPFSLMFFLRDRIFKKIEKTHIEFQENIKKTKVTISTFN